MKESINYSNKLSERNFNILPSVGWMSGQRSSAKFVGTNYATIMRTMSKRWHFEDLE